MVAPPSCPLNNISLLFIADLITKSDVAILNLPNSVPPSFSMMSVPSASRIISPDESSVKSPVDSKVEPEIILVVRITPVDDICPNEPVAEVSKLPVMSTPVLVTLNLSELFTNVLTSFEVPNVMYSWSAAVPIFHNEELIIDVMVVCAAPTAKLLLVVISPPPDNPSPAVKVTPLWSMCSFATNPAKLS